MLVVGLNGVGRTPTLPAAPHPGHVVPAGPTAKAFASVCSNPANGKLAEPCAYVRQLVWTFQHVVARFSDASPWSGDGQVPPLPSGWACDSGDQPRRAERSCVASQLVRKGRAVGQHVRSLTPLRPPCCEGAQASRGGHAPVLLWTDLRGTPARGGGGG